MSMVWIAGQSFPTGSSAASISFTSIPQTFTHLELRLFGRTLNSSGTNYTAYLNLNSDSGSNYARHLLRGDGATASSDLSAASTTGPWFSAVSLPSNTQTSGVFGVSISQILDYTNTAKNKTIRSISGYDNNGNGMVSLSSSLWINTAAITRIDIIPDGGGLTQHSRLDLYGITTSSVTGA